MQKWGPRVWGLSSCLRPASATATVPLCEAPGRQPTAIGVDDDAIIIPCLMPPRRGDRHTGQARSCRWAPSKTCLVHASTQQPAEHVSASAAATTWASVYRPVRRPAAPTCRRCRCGWRERPLSVGAGQRRRRTEYKLRAGTVAWQYGVRSSSCIASLRVLLSASAMATAGDLSSHSTARRCSAAFRGARRLAGARRPSLLGRCRPLALCIAASWPALFCSLSQVWTGCPKAMKMLNGAN